ncbi:MAG: PSD1 and planctomycete cytochrome C domain-containing protein [Bryobacteraceae bacterium]
MRGGKSGPAIVPGQGEQSLLVARIRGHSGLRMPPSGPPWAAEQVQKIVRWIDQGAVFDGAVEGPGRVAKLAPRMPVIPPGTLHPLDYLTRRQLKQLKPISDEQFARRLWLDVIGLPPTPEELDVFLRSKAADKRGRAVEALLLRRQAYAEHWISFWNDLLRNDEGVIYHGERKSITNWLLAALEKNMPYDTMVRSLLDPQRNVGSEGFLTGVSWRGVVSASQTAPMQAAQNAAQVFLGINLKCAGCHDSFINRWKLQDTYGLASMFSSEPLELVRCDVRLGKMAKPQFPFDSLNVGFGDNLDSRRKAAAEWFVHPENGRFARTLVNRYWKQLLGRGIVEPVDDMDAAPWNQDLLDWLASDFARNGYNLQRLIRFIVTSQAYQSKTVAAPEPYVFRGPVPRRLSAEQIQDAISTVTGEWRVNSKRTEVYSSYTREWRLKSDPLSRALGRPIRDQVYTERNADATTLQALELTNGPVLAKRLERGAMALLGKLPATPSNCLTARWCGPVRFRLRWTLPGRQLWLLVEDVDSYDPSRVSVGWANAELLTQAR